MLSPLNHHPFQGDEESAQGKTRKRPRQQQPLSRASMVVTALLGLVVVAQQAHGFDTRLLLVSSTSSSIGIRPLATRTTSTRCWIKHDRVRMRSSVALLEDNPTENRWNNDDDDDSFLPPWLRAPSSRLQGESSADILQEELEFLKWELSERHGWSSQDIDDLIQTLWVTFSHPKWMLGCLDFMETLLKLEELATPSILLASIVHYAECLGARQDGVYPAVQEQLLRGSTGIVQNDAKAQKHRLALAPSLQDDHGDIKPLQIQGNESNVDATRRSRRRRLHSSKSLKRSKSLLGSGSFSPLITPLAPEIQSISKAASQIKRAEIVSEIVLVHKDYEQIQNLLLSVSGDDWRALAIRCVASLYRIQGILRFSMSSGKQPHRLNMSLAAARSALYIYAPLAQRLGLHALKTQLESKAFGILYPRQYKAALGLFERQGASMRAVCQYLQHQIRHLLDQDPTLANVDVSISARVKEPYSFWKKLLRKSSKGGTGRSMILRFDSELSRHELSSILKVRDGVALRVIIQSHDDDDKSPEERRHHEQLLCYHIHHLIRAVFPESHPSRVKDYIREPKPNGYQSLHHTSVIRYGNLEIPFEVQVRTLEMHRVAEFGVAAHWDYKQQQAVQATAAVGNDVRLAKTRNLPALPPADPRLLQSTTASTIPRDTSVVALGKERKQEPNKPPMLVTTPYLQALERARQSLVDSSVFVFLAGKMEHGQLVSVRKGQPIRDILHEYLDGDDKKKNEWQVWRNGRLASWEEPVQNGDVLLFQPDNSSHEHERLLDASDKEHVLLQAKGSLTHVE